jgi:alkylated DNA repair dioxygenase AlkB
VRHLPGWLAAPEAARLLERCETELAFAAHPVRLFGREHLTPRETVFLAPAGVRYRYSGHEHRGTGMPAWLDALRRRLGAETGVELASVLATRYRCGADRVGWHADDERELGPEPVLVVLSLGSSRDLDFRARRPAPGRRRRWRVALSAGDLLVMEAGTQSRLEHAVPPRAGRGVRVSLSFRPHRARP